jgi:hypothetical protein
MYAVVRRYNTSAGSIAEIAQRVNEGFLPLVSQVQGFISYDVIDAGDGTMLTVSVFEDRAGADESTRAATEWVRQNLTHLIRTAPVVTTGEILVHSVAHAVR